MVLKVFSWPGSYFVACVPVTTSFSFGEKAAWQRSLELGSESQTNTGVFEFLTSHSRIVSSVPLVTNFELSRYILTCDMAVPGWWACGISTLGLEVMRKSYAMIVPSRQPATICSPF